MNDNEYNYEKRFLFKVIIGTIAVIIYMFWSNSQNPWSGGSYNGGFYTVIFIIIFLMGFIIWHLIKELRGDAPFRSIENRLKNELAEASDRNDWRLEQSLKLELLWIKIVKKKKHESGNNIISKSTLSLPDNFHVENSLHYAFCSEVISKLGEFYASGKPFEDLKKGTHCIYKSEALLPFSVNAFFKCGSFIKKYMLKNQVVTQLTKNHIDSMAKLLSVIGTDYLNVDPSEIPTECFENVKFGKEFKGNDDLVF